MSEEKKNNELQNTDFILPGGLGNVIDGNGNVREITKVESNYQRGSITFTIGPPKEFPVNPPIEPTGRHIFYEVATQKQIVLPTEDDALTDKKS